MGKNGSVTRAEAVQRFLQQNAGKEFCHKCLAKAVGVKSVHRYIFQLINNPFFVRRRGRCEACASHRPKLLARYRGKPSPHEQKIDRWMEDYNTVHPHSRLGYRSPREYINAKSQSAACPV